MLWLYMQYFFQITGLPGVWPLYAPILPDFVQNMSFYCFSSVEACLPGNTVLKLLKLLTLHVCAISAKMCHFQ